VAKHTALVTGATAGIGAAFARQLAQGSYDLVIVARNAQRLAATAGQLRDEHGVAVEGLAVDLSTDAGCEKVAARLADPGVPVDLLVNSAGMSLNTPFLRSSAEKETQLLCLNVHAVMRLTLAALPGMVERRRGAIVNISSGAAIGPGRGPYPDPTAVSARGGTCYGAEKAALERFTQGKCAVPPR